MKNKKSIFITVGVVCLAASAFWYSSVSGTSVEKKQTEKTIARPIPTSQVGQISASSFRTFPGSVRATERVDMAFSITGLLTELNATEGTAVKKGQVIARLDPRDAQNNYQAATARYEIAKKNFERAKKLSISKVIPPAELDSSTSNFNISAAELRIRKKALDDTILMAPFDGIVSKRHVENFQHIKAKDTILSLKDISKIDIVIQVPEKLIAYGGGKRFGDVKVSFDARPHKWYNASIKEFSIESDPVTRTFEVVVSLDPPKDMGILPGMTATVKAPLNRSTDKVQTNIYMIPLAAVAGDSDSSSFVWVIPEEIGNPVKTAVKTGKIRNDGIEILDGLQSGQLVATAGIHSLQSDMQVRPANNDKEGLNQ